MSEMNIKCESLEVMNVVGTSIDIVMIVLWLHWIRSRNRTHAIVGYDVLDFAEFNKLTEWLFSNWI